MFSKMAGILVSKLGAETHAPAAGSKTSFPQSRPRGGKIKGTNMKYKVYNSVENCKNVNYNMKYEALSHIFVVKTKKLNIIRI